MIIDSFYGAVLILTNASRASEIAERIASDYFPEDQAYHYKVTESIPDNLPVDLNDQASASFRDAPSGSVVLTVYPFAGTSTP